MSVASWWRSVLSLGRHYRCGFQEMAATWSNARLVRQELASTPEKLATFHQQETLRLASSNTHKLVLFAVMAVLPASYIVLPALLAFAPTSLPRALLTQSQREMADKAHRRALEESFCRWRQIFSSGEKNESAALLKSVIEGRSSVDEILKSRSRLQNTQTFVQSRLSSDVVDQRVLLKDMCTMLSLLPIGPKFWLRRTVSAAFRDLAKEDKILAHYGIEVLDSAEVSSACLRRAMVVPAQENSSEKGRQLLQRWLSARHELQETSTSEPVNMLLLLSVLQHTQSSTICSEQFKKK